PYTTLFRSARPGADQAQGGGVHLQGISLRDRLLIEAAASLSQWQPTSSSHETRPNSRSSPAAFSRPTRVPDEVVSAMARQPMDLADPRVSVLIAACET